MNDGNANAANVNALIEIPSGKIVNYSMGEIKTKLRGVLKHSKLSDDSIQIAIKILEPSQRINVFIITVGGKMIDADPSVFLIADGIVGRKSEKAIGGFKQDLSFISSWFVVLIISLLGFFIAYVLQLYLNIRKYQNSTIELSSPQNFDAELLITSQPSHLSADQHIYDLIITVKNNSTTPLTNYYVDLSIPWEFLLIAKPVEGRDDNRSDNVRACFRKDFHQNNESIYPYDELIIWKIQCQMNS